MRYLRRGTVAGPRARFHQSDWGAGGCSGDFCCLGAIRRRGGLAAWAQAVLDPDDVGEETITLPEDNAPFVFRNGFGRGGDRSTASSTRRGRASTTARRRTAGSSTTATGTARVGFRIVQPMDSATLRLKVRDGAWAAQQRGRCRRPRSRTGSTGSARRCAGSRRRSIRTTAPCRSGRAARRRTGRRGSIRPSPSS